tara:strand:- start:3825 stop:4736 length:912 start_codon:yes stop_codon:yes gene_type:complete
MVIVRLKGGVGNQMFLYAIGRHLSIRNKTPLKLDLTYLKLNKQRNYELKYFNINAKVIPLLFGSTIPSRIFFKTFKILSKILKKRSLYPRQKNYYFDKEILDMKVFILDDYWTSENYFKDISETIKKEFTLKDNLNKENEFMLKKIIGSNSICIHLRRGDVTPGSKRAKKVGKAFSLDYYKNSIKLIEKKVKNPYFFVFSDGIEWAKKNFKINSPTVYVDINGPDEGSKDLNLMKHCKHFIIASTFSWWAAWLSENKDKIILASKVWFNPLEKNEIPKNTKKKWPYIRDEGDIIPKRWIRVED